MKFLYAFLFCVFAVMMSFSLGSREWQLAFISLATIVGYLLGSVSNLSKEIKALRGSLAQKLEQQQTEILSSDTSDETHTNQELSPDSDSNGDTESPSEDYLDVVNQAAASVESDQNIPETQAANWDSSWNTADTVVDGNLEATTANSLPKEPRGPSIADKIGNAVKGYFTGGNMFVRIGIIILFFGVSFLLKYVSDRGFFPIEYRLIGVVIGAMCLLGLGWRLRHKNETYALLLQGAGIGVLYLDIFAAYNLYQLIPPIAAFVLLFVVSMFSAALAVLQDSKSLAVLGFSGGFLAPILASSGSDNHVGLFSYYALLNIAIVVIAWFKAWRELNLLGFAFTFIIGTIWGVLRYNSDKFSTTEPFLIIFFLFYVLIAVLYALRQPLKLRGYVDGTLLFGVPLAASGLQYYLVKDYEYGVSISSFVMGAFYMVLAWFIWQRKGQGLKLLSEAFLALGVIFASMAIPFALAPTQTAAAWALEGAGFIWLGSRQNRLSVRSFGVLLQLAAGAIFLSRYEFIKESQAFINGEFISSVMLAVAGIFSARLLIKSFDGKKHWENYLSPVLLVWGLTWLIGDFTLQLVEHFPERLLVSSMLIFIAGLSLLLAILAIRTKPLWKHAFIAAFTLFILVLFVGFVQALIAAFSSTLAYHPSMSYGWFAWPFVFGVYYYLLHLLHKNELFPRFQTFFHTVLLLFAVLLLTIEGEHWLSNTFKLQSAWIGIWLAVPATITLWKIIKAKFWPFSRFQKSLTKYSGSILALALGFWSFIALTDKGTSDPLPWIPLLNPLDVMLMIVFITLFKWWQSFDSFGVKNEDQSETSLIGGSLLKNRKVFNKRLLVMGFVALAFLWLNFNLFRIAHHWFGVSWDEGAMYGSNLVQTAVSILWALSGVILTLYASHKNKRLLWMIGAVLLGLVVLKLFVIDLSALGSLGRIVSFLVVGALFMSIGYFAPLPDKSEDIEDDEVTVADDDDKSIDENHLESESDSEDLNKEDVAEENGDNKNA